MARKASSRPNLALVAKKLNLSIPTVWRALRDVKGIHPQTRDLVVQTASELGYVIPKIAVEMAQTKTHTILVLAHCPPHGTSLAFTTGISRAALQFNLNVLIHQVEFSNSASILVPALQPKAMKSDMINGIILISRWNPEVAEYLSSKWPTISITHRYAETKIDHVGVDDRIGMLSLVKHLHAAGHRKIGFFGMNREVSWACSRVSAFFEAIMLCDIEYDKNNIVSISVENSMSFLPFPSGAWSKQLLNQIKQGTDAWICSSSATANTLYRFLVNKGIKMPDDVSLAGFHRGVIDTTPDLPVITSTIVNETDIGFTAVQRLKIRMENLQEPPRSILLPCEFGDGETTRRPK